jgi:hypothetical protein
MWCKITLFEVTMSVNPLLLKRQVARRKAKVDNRWNATAIWKVSAEQKEVIAMTEKAYCVYISCVGEQDPISQKTEVEGPLLTCFHYLTKCKNIDFNAVYLIPTSKECSPQRHTEERAEECAQKIGEDYPNLPVTLLPLKVRNPADLKQAYPGMRGLLEEIVEEAKQCAQEASIIFHINTSSGTPQMKESLPFLVSVGQLKPHKSLLWQVFDPRGGATTLEERVQRAPELDLLTQERILLRLEQSAKQHMYREANDWVRNSLNVEHLKFARRFYPILAAHDRWEYKQASNDLKSMLEGQSVIIPDFLKDWLNKVSQWLERVANADKEALSIDRYFCACRRLESGLFPDAVSNYWTACELALKKHWEEIFPTETPPPAGNLVERLKESRSTLNNSHVQFSGFPGLPSQQSNPILDALYALRNVRNKIEHGSRPVTPQIAEGAKQIAEKLLKDLNLGQEMQNCPLHPEFVKDNLLKLIYYMRDSLWR